MSQSCAAYALFRQTTTFNGGHWRFRCITCAEQSRDDFIQSIQGHKQHERVGLREVLIGGATGHAGCYCKRACHTAMRHGNSGQSRNRCRRADSRNHTPGNPCGFERQYFFKSPAKYKRVAAFKAYHALPRFGEVNDFRIDVFLPLRFEMPALLCGNFLAVLRDQIHDGRRDQSIVDYHLGVLQRIRCGQC